MPHEKNKTAVQYRQVYKTWPSNRNMDWPIKKNFEKMIDYLVKLASTSKYICNTDFHSITDQT